MPGPKTRGRQQVRLNNSPHKSSCQGLNPPGKGRRRGGGQSILVSDTFEWKVQYVCKFVLVFRVLHLKS